MKRTAQERFMEKVIPEPNTGCWLWLGAQNKQGYGQFSFRKKVRRAHRASYAMFIGDFDEFLLVCHKCDTPQCVNPNHLFIGTQSQNVQDCLKKNRFKAGADWVGEKNPATKLTSDLIRKIKLDAPYMRRKHIAMKYNIHLRTVFRILASKTWGHVKA